MSTHKPGPTTAGPAVFSPARDDGLRPWPIDPGAIEAGDPRAGVRVCTTSPDGLLESGVWSCTAGRFRLTYGCDEVVQIVAGEVIVHHGASSRRLTVGDAAYFSAGTVTVWEIPMFVRKSWVMRYPRPSVLRRAARWARSRLSAPP